MGIKIEKFKNVYGINDLKNVSEINGNALIYAPNGGTKSSLALGFKSIAKGIKPNDRIFGKECEYRFILNNKLYSNDNDTIIDNIVVYNFEEYYKESLENSGDKINLLTISTKIQKKYGEVYQDCLNQIDILSKKIASIIGNKKKENDNLSITLEFFANNFNLHSLKEITLFLSAINWNEKIDISTNINNILNKNTIPIISSEDFIEKVNKLNNTINSKIASVLFKDDFNSIEASKLIKMLSNDGFFEAGHAIKLSGTEELITSSTQFKKIYDDQINLIYNDEQTKKDVEDLLTKINKNKSTKTIKNFISSPEIIVQMNDFNKFCEKILAGCLKDLENEIKETAKIINDSEDAINNLMKEAEQERTEWETICDIFNNRFIVPFEITVKDRFNSIIGKSSPTFEIEYKKDEMKAVITEELLKKTLSTGELRALTILQFLFDLHTSINKNEETFVILDDIVDSFDYKNKYAMIEYISEISRKGKIICWILTHNFDFFSSCKYRINSFKKYFIKQNKNSESFQKFNESIIGGGMELFSNWKESINGKTDEKKLLALIPVCRNIIELKYGTNDTRYETLCSILHYRKNTKDILISDINPLFLDTFNIKCTIDEKEKVFDILFKQLSSLKKNELLNSMNLDDKIILAMGIRIDMEIIFNKFNTNLINQNLRLGEEFEKVKCNFKPNEIEIFSKALISIPEFIHLNSFMYEPLIDIPTINLYKIYQEVEKIKKSKNV